jgi:hypothetical protein
VSRFTRPADRAPTREDPRKGTVVEIGAVLREVEMLPVSDGADATFEDGVLVPPAAPDAEPAPVG